MYKVKMMKVIEELRDSIQDMYTELYGVRYHSIILPSSSKDLEKLLNGKKDNISKETREALSIKVNHMGNLKYSAVYGIYKDFVFKYVYGEKLNIFGSVLELDSIYRIDNDILNKLHLLNVKINVAMIKKLQRNNKLYRIYSYE